MAKMSEQWDRRHLTVITKPLSINVPVQGNLLRRFYQRFETLPKTTQVIKTCENAGFMRKISLGQYFVTIHDMDDGFGSAGSCRSRKYENWSSAGSRVTHQLYQKGIKLRV